jgi:hypothetical protein
MPFGSEPENISGKRVLNKQFDTIVWIFWGKM